ncbi:MAG: 2-C-methyl-D-erythritol 4-phosphate cytidylyltransferase, partial [Bacteroidales bacterium]|nr:2-C-methyl-D-erythritol 4-phosphate cytidylyltransferase [Bacteroidales bacterium]
MTTAIILAGGSGVRMGAEIPKQFIEVNGKPILVYTLEGFQAHPLVDEIGVVCLDGWHDRLRKYAKDFSISKLKWIISGGNTGQESIRNGVFHLEGKCDEKDIIVIHDGIRPLIEPFVLTDVIEKCNEY